MLCILVGKHNPSQGTYRGKEAVLFVPLLSSAQQLTARSQMAFPCQGRRPPAGKIHVKITLPTNEHLGTAAHSYTRKRIQTLFGNEAC
jgi:hypothetical protein